MGLKLIARGAVALVASALVAPAAIAAAGPAGSWIVQAVTEQAAANAVVGAGGTVGLHLDIVHGVAARLTPGQATLLAGSGSVVVTPDESARPTGAGFDASNAPAQLTALDLPAGWSSTSGSGVHVALIDTGVADVAGLSNAVRPVDSNGQVVDFSGEGDGIDHFGHGTFMAGLIAGNGSVAASDGAHYPGVAPGATVVSVKVAGADGTTTLSKIIAGIGWVVVNRDALHIRVINLSFGVSPLDRGAPNPLDGAVEAAWAAGMTVVAAAGNEGVGHVTSPGDDPWVITAGAVDFNGNVPSWSGTGQGKPDVLAPAVSVVSLRAPGSTIDRAHPDAGNPYLHGTGTSMATALTSGAAALLYADHPAATPDDIKGALTTTGGAVHGGPGVTVDIAAADAAQAKVTWNQHHAVAFDGLGLGLNGAMPWDAASWTAASWTAASWTAASWTAASWTAASWTAASWTAASWTAASWTAASWTAASWTAASWTAQNWS